MSFRPMQCNVSPATRYLKARNITAPLLRKLTIGDSGFTGSRKAPGHPSCPIVSTILFIFPKLVALQNHLELDEGKSGQEYMQYIQGLGNDGSIAID